MATASSAPFTDLTDTEPPVSTNPVVEMMMNSRRVSDLGAGPRHPAHSSVRDEEAPRHGTDTAVVTLTNVHKTYLLGIEGVPALRGVSLTIARGEFLVILGKSGGGKTTMLNMMGTIDKPSRGDVCVCGTHVSRRTTDRQLADIRLNRLGFVFQTFNLLPSMTATENVQMPMVLAGQMSRAERRSRARLLLSRVGMGHREDHYPSQLSGGEQQRVTIARALANRPEVLLLDEPTGDLDNKNSDIVLKLLTDLNRKDHVTLIMVTHDVHLKRFANRVVHMLDGKISRIEHIDEAVRTEALEELNASKWVRAMAAPLSAGTRDTFVDTSNPADPARSHTQVRRPLDYSTLQFAASRMGVHVPNPDLPSTYGSAGAGAGVGAGVGAGAAAAGFRGPGAGDTGAAAAGGSGYLGRGPAPGRWTSASAGPWGPASAGLPGQPHGVAADTPVLASTASASVASVSVSGSTVYMRPSSRESARPAVTTAATAFPPQPVRSMHTSPDSPGNKYTVTDDRQPASGAPSSPPGVHFTPDNAVIITPPDDVEDA